MPRIDVVADDLGYSASRDAALLACARAGGVTAVSLLVNGETKQHGDLAAQAAQNVDHQPALGRAQPGHGFVQQQHARPGGQRDGPIVVRGHAPLG